MVHGAFLIMSEIVLEPHTESNWETQYARN